MYIVSTGRPPLLPGARCRQTHATAGAGTTALSSDHERLTAHAKTTKTVKLLVVMTHLTVRVIPRSSKPGIAGIRDGALLVRLQSPPVEGAANDELIQVMAETFGGARRDVEI